MGIRIHKRLGFGITDLNLTDDPRFDLQVYHLWVEREFDRDHFEAWCVANETRLSAVSRAEGNSPSGYFLFLASFGDKKRKLDPSQFLCAAEENGLDQVLLLQHPNCPDWSRYDDVIDYYDHRGSLEPAVKSVPSTGIYPEQGGLKRFRELPPDLGILVQQHPFWSDRLASGLLGEHQHDVSIPLSNATPEQQAAFVQHLREDWRPRIPMGILAVIEYAGCFPDPYGQNGIVNSLRPLIYTYWN